MWKMILLVGVLVGQPSSGWSEDAAADLNLMDLRWQGSIKTSTAQIPEGGSEYSLRWDAGQQPTSSAKVVLPSDMADWSGYQTLKFSIFAEEENESVLAIMIVPNDVGEGVYYLYKFPLDWTGWKDFEVPLNTLFKVRNPQGRNNIQRLEILSHYGAPPVSGTILYLNNFRLTP
jgi:hypothetical protein